MLNYGFVFVGLVCSLVLFPLCIFRDFVGGVLTVLLTC